MAIASDRAIRVLLQILSDTEGLKKLDSDLDKTKEKLDEVGDAGKGAADKADELKNRLTVAFGIGAIAAAPFVIMLQQSGELVAQLSEDILEQTRALDKQVDSWLALARGAQTFADSIKLADRVAADVSAMVAHYEKFRSTELTKWQSWADTVPKLLNPLEAAAGALGPNQSALNAATEKFRDTTIQGIRSANAVLDMANASVQRVTDIKAMPIAEGIFKVTESVEKLQGKLNDLDAQRQLPIGATDQQIKASEQALIKYQLIGNELKGEKALLSELVTEQNRQTPAVEKTKQAHDGLRDTLTAERLQLQAIQAEIANIEASPFMTVDQKNTALTQLIPAQIETINAMIANNKAQLANSFFDPAQHNALQAAIQRDEAAIVGLQQKLQLTSFTGQFRASLVSFVNQVGTTAQQVGQAITSTIGIAINGVSNAIMGAITRTQSWGQAFAQVAQSIIGNLIQIGLQFIAQKVLGSILTATTVTEQTTAGAAIAAANAPAAAATSIASYGGAAVAGGSAAMAAIAAIMGALGGFEIGGFTGPGGSQDVAGLVHRGEYVMPKSAVDSAGIGAMDSFRASVEGGRGGGGVAIFNFTDMKLLEKAYLQSTAAKKMIIHTVNGAGGNLRT